MPSIVLVPRLCVAGCYPLYFPSIASSSLAPSNALENDNATICSLASTARMIASPSVCHLLTSLHKSWTKASRGNLLSSLDNKACLCWGYTVAGPFDAFDARYAEMYRREVWFCPLYQTQVHLPNPDGSLPCPQIICAIWSILKYRPHLFASLILEFHDYCRPLQYARMKTTWKHAVTISGREEYSSNGDWVPLHRICQTHFPLEIHEWLDFFS